MQITGLAITTKNHKHLYYNDSDGLPRNIITCLEQDDFGYLWVGTGSGLSRFNGTNFTTYERLNEQVIRAISIDSENNVWVLSDAGIFKLNRCTDKFNCIYEGYTANMQCFNKQMFYTNNGNILRYTLGGKTQKVVEGNIQIFYIDKDGIWYKNKEQLWVLPHNSKKPQLVTDVAGRNIKLIRIVDNKIFLGCYSGKLFVINEQNEEFEVELNNHHTVYEIVKIDDEYWLASDGNGIIILNEELKFKRRLVKNETSNTTLVSNSIYDIYQGRYNEIWIASYGGGLMCLVPEDSPFVNIVPNTRNRNSLVAKEGVGIFHKKNTFYFGTNYGLSVYNELDDKFYNLNRKFLKKNLLGSKVIAINSDHKENIWLGTYDGLLGKYTKNLEFISAYRPCGPASQKMQRIIFIEKIDNNNFLIATQSQNKSLLYFDTSTYTFTPVTIKQNGRRINNYNVTSLRNTPKGESIVLIKSKGLFHVDTEKLELVNNLPEVNNRLSFRLHDFHIDHKGFYWFATQQNGLVRMSNDGRIFDKWTTTNGFPTNTLQRIESVDDRYLWISTIAGLCRFDMETEKILIYNNAHGLPTKEFSPRTSCKTADGKLTFGSNAGFTIVDPKKVGKQKSDSKVVISDITFQNQSIKSLTNEPILNKPLEATKKIVLPFKRNSFTIHFFSKGKDLPKLNNYAYRLAGLEDSWIYLGKNHRTTYTNLLPGTYTFEVKSTNNSNIWNHTPTKLIIEITPPWYLTWIAFAGYLLLLTLIVVIIHRIYTNRIQLKKEVEMSEFKVKKEHELTERKLAFFTNISHDLKTPLTLIDAPVKDLLEENDISIAHKNKLNIIKRNSQHLYKLISDILDFRKLTQNQLPLKVKEININDLIRNTYESFRGECLKKEIDFVLECSIEEQLWLDEKKIEKILWNLLSNAIKFTEENGRIELNASIDNKENEAFLHLQINDSGVGISEDEIDKIFNRFYQKQSLNHTTEGSGIGLSIVKDLIELHHGNIQVKSTPGEGSSFTLIIPVNRDFYNDTELSIEQDKEVRQETFTQLNTEDYLNEYHQENQPYNLPVLLLVEDNEELREYLADYFHKCYKVLQAADGQEGLDILSKKKPDIILTDVCMPNIDGYNFCKEIRNNFEISHLPVVMLTANGVVDHQIEGLAVGADSYITKPFDVKYVEAVMQSLLENRRKIRNRFMGIDKSIQEENTLPQKDTKFIDTLHHCIQNNINNKELNIDLLVNELAISRTQLNRKIKSLTGQTPNNLIKSIRLKKAYELISKEGIRVSEAAYQVGFSDPNYFTICFKKEFGENPSQINIVENKET